MNTTKELIKYHFRSYLKSNKLVMPISALMIFLFFLYKQISAEPVDVIGSFTLSMVCLFFLMTWIGLTYNDIENPVSEQLLILKVRSEKRYYLSRNLFLIIIGIIMSIITVLFPVIQNLLINFQVLSIIDVLLGLLLHCFVAFTGSMTGAFLHPRIMKDRKLAVVLTFLMALMGVIKISINVKIPITRYITWVFPPISNFMKAFAGASFYDSWKVGSSLLLLGGYGIALMILQIHLLIKNKF